MISRFFSRIFKPSFSTYTQSMFEAWKAEPSVVHPDWDAYFKSTANQLSTSSTTSPTANKDKALALSAYLLIRYYKSRGHELAELDPLSMSSLIDRIGEFQRVWQSIYSAELGKWSQNQSNIQRKRFGCAVQLSSSRRVHSEYCCKLNLT